MPLRQLLIKIKKSSASPSMRKKEFLHEKQNISSEICNAVISYYSRKRMQFLSVHVYDQISNKRYSEQKKVFRVTDAYLCYFNFCRTVFRTKTDIRYAHRSHYQ